MRFLNDEIINSMSIYQIFEKNSGKKSLKQSKELGILLENNFDILLRKRLKFILSFFFSIVILIIL